MDSIHVFFTRNYVSYSLVYFYAAECLIRECFYKNNLQRDIILLLLVIRMFCRVRMKETPCIKQLDNFLLTRVVQNLQYWNPYRSSSTPAPNQYSQGYVGNFVTVKKKVLFQEFIRKKSRDELICHFFLSERGKIVDIFSKFSKFCVS